MRGVPVRFRTVHGTEEDVWLLQHTFKAEGPDGKVLGTRQQYLIHLAYAVTVHKLQVLTLDWLVNQW